MPPSFATRYTLIVLLISIVFAIIYEILELVGFGLPFTLASFRQTLTIADVLILLVPFTFTALAYVAGRQRDRAAAQARYLDTINRIIRTLTRSLDLDRTLPEALDQTVAALNVEGAAVCEIDRDQVQLRAATPRIPETLLSAVQTMPSAQWQSILKPTTGGQQLITLDLAQSGSAFGDLRRAGYRGLISALILVESQASGALLVIVREQARLTPEQANFLITTANQIGAAMTRARPYAEVRRRARDLEAIAQVNRTLLASLGLDNVLEMIVTAAQVRFGLPYVAVLWVDEVAGEFFIRAQAGPLVALAPLHHRQKLTEGLSAQVYRTGQPYLARDVRDEPAYIPVTNAPVLSSLLVPMKASDKVIGIMMFNSLGLDAFSEADVAALTTLTDQITIAAENARLYAEAQRERRRLGAILHSTRDVVMLIDPAGRVQLMNPAAERVLGVQAAEGIGRPIESVLSEPLLLDAYKWLSDRPPEEASPPREVTLSSGSTYLVTLTGAKDEAQIFFGRVVVLQDITALKQLDQFKTQMVQMASHDLRNPLGVAMGYVEMLVEELRPLTPLRQQALNGLESSLTRMQTLVAELLDMERLESGVDQTREPVELDRLTEAVVVELKEQAAAKHQTLDIAIASALPAISGDPVRLKQALSNLVGNAIKYTPEAGHIWVRLARRDDRIVFEVQDTGYGIPKTSQAKLFQRFYRAKAPGTENIDGTGLGLSLVKLVIEQHGGRVSVESEVGQGSTFRVELPVGRVDQVGKG